MIVLDAYAVLAFLKGEPAAAEVHGLLDGADLVSLTTLGVAEVLDHLVRIVGATEEDAVLDLAQLRLSDPPALDPGLAARAGLLRARHYHRRDRAVSLADCVAAETARSVTGTLATSDPHLLDLCHHEAVNVIPLPGTTGAVWKP